MNLLSSPGCKWREMECTNASEEVHVKYRHKDLKGSNKVWIVKTIDRKHCLVKQRDGYGHAAIAETGK